MARTFNSRLGADKSVYDENSGEWVSVPSINQDEYADTPTPEDYSNREEFLKKYKEILRGLDKSRSPMEHATEVSMDADENPEEYPAIDHVISFDAPYDFGESSKSWERREKIRERRKRESSKVKTAAISPDQMVPCYACGGMSRFNTPGNEAYQNHCLSCGEDEHVCDEVGNDLTTKHCNGCKEEEHCAGRQRLSFPDCDTCHNKGDVCPDCDNNLKSNSYCGTCGKWGTKEETDPDALDYPRVQTRETPEPHLSDEPTEEETVKYLRAFEQADKRVKTYNSRMEEQHGTDAERESSENEHAPFSSTNFDPTDILDKEQEEAEKETEVEAPGPSDKELEEEEASAKHENNNPPVITVIPPHSPYCTKCDNGIINDPKEIKRINTDPTVKKKIREIESTGVSDNIKDQQINKFMAEQYRCKG